MTSSTSTMTSSTSDKGVLFDDNSSSKVCHQKCDLITKTTSSSSSSTLRTKMQPSLLANELNPEVILAAQIVLGLFVLIITLLLAFPRFELVLELIFEAVGTLVGIVVLLLQIIHDLHQIISITHEGFQQIVLVLKLIGKVVGSRVSLVVLLLRLTRICRRIWSILTEGQPVVVANDHRNDVPLADINYGQNDIPPTDAEADATNGQNDVIVNEEVNI